MKNYFEAVDLNIAYDVKDDRPFWKTRLLAIALAAIIGSFPLTSLGVMLVGPQDLPPQPADM